MSASPPNSLRESLKRRSFLALLPQTLAGATLIPLLNSSSRVVAQSPAYAQKTAGDSVCWLDVCAPFIAEDPEIGLHSEIVLTSDTFVGVRGHEDRADATEYEIFLYDAQGNAVGPGGVARRLVVPAMQITVLSLREILGDHKPFWGGMRIRLRPKGRAPMHASDLFSSAFVRWKTENSFDNVHANPDPLEWQRPNSFFYSMPYPPLTDYDCVYSLFNPNPESSIGSLAVYDHLGKKLRERSYDLKPHSSLLYDLRQGELINSTRAAFGFDRRPTPLALTPNGGSLVVTNREGTVKSFGYLLIKRPKVARFSVEHPIHQPPFKPVSAPSPFDMDGRFKAKNILYTPLLFCSKRLGGVTLETRFHFSSGAPIEEFLWLNPFIADREGNIAWQVTEKARLPAGISPAQTERRLIKLGAMQSCVFDCSQIGLPKGFGGGMFLAVAPTTNHTLMKVEISAQEWGAHAFSHFRPGLQAARSYQKPPQRGGLATDYIASGARLETAGKRIIRDEIIAVVNIDDRAVAGRPVLEIFTSQGLQTRLDLGAVPSFASRQYLLSELASERIGAQDLSLRLIDEHATLLMSVVHLDYVRRDLAIDHGSDRFSTYNDYDCNAAM